MKRFNWPVTFSMGVVTCNGAICSFDKLLTEADNLMYSVKKTGKNMIKQANIEAEA
jgi:PleD family two-component response regulator